MRELLYYSLMLLLGLAWYRYGQTLLAKGFRDETGEPTQGVVGPIGFLVCAGVASYLLFAVLRALARGEIACAGRGCGSQVYTLAGQPGQFWANIFFLSWMVLAIGYGMYVTFKIWTRP